MSGGPAWWEGRTPPVPEAFRGALEVPGDGDGPVEALGDAGCRALAVALRPDGRERMGAFDLLAADGLLTWAAEEALRGPDPEEALEGLARRIAAAGEGGHG